MARWFLNGIPIKSADGTINATLSHFTYTEKVRNDGTKRSIKSVDRSEPVTDLMAYISERDKTRSAIKALTAKGDTSSDEYLALQAKNVDYVHQCVDITLPVPAERGMRDYLSDPRCGDSDNRSVLRKPLGDEPMTYTFSVPFDLVYSNTKNCAYYNADDGRVSMLSENDPRAAASLGCYLNAAFTDESQVIDVFIQDPSRRNERGYYSDNKVELSARELEVVVKCTVLDSKGSLLYANGLDNNGKSIAKSEEVLIDRSSFGSSKANEVDYLDDNAFSGPDIPDA